MKLKLSSLLGPSAAILLMASPAIAASTVGATSSTDDTSTRNRAVTREGASGAAYRHIGQGGFSGEAMPIKNNNGNGGASGNANNGGVFANNNGNAADTDQAARPSQRNNMLADNGDVRIGKMIGSSVYNDQDQKIGSVDGVVTGHNGLWAIVSTNDKKVAVPFKDFVFGNSQANSDDQLVLPRYTQARLNALPVFHYDAANYANNNGNGNNG